MKPNSQHEVNEGQAAIGDLRLNRQRRLLLRGDEKIQLPKLSFELFSSLVRHAPGIVTTEQLLGEVWGDVVVGEETVKQRISLLRQALGDNTDNPTYIESVRGVGYRLVAPVRYVNAKENLAGGKWRMRLALVAVFAIVVTVLYMMRVERVAIEQSSRQSIAVLPFEDISADRDKAYFSDGIHEEIIARLSGIDALSVTSRTSVLPYRNNETKNLREIAAELGVGLIIEGSVRHSEDRVRVAIQLIDAGNDKHVWARNYDRPLSIADLFDIQIDIAERIAAALEAELTPEEAETLHELPTDSLESYNALLLGRHYVLRGNAQDLRKSIGFYDQAISADPSFGQAHLEYAAALTFIGTNYGWMAPREAFPLAEEKINKALQLGAHTAGALSLQGDILTWYRWQWEEAEKVFRRAYAMDPGVSLGYMLLLSVLERHDEALALTEAAIERYPRDHWVRSNAAWRFLSAGDQKRAIAEANTAIEIDPTFGDQFGSRGTAYLQLGQIEQALEDFGRHVEIQNRSPASLALLAEASAKAGDDQAAEDLLDEVLALRGTGFVPPEEIARVLVALNRFGEAFEWLEKAYAARSRGLIFMNTHSSWDAIRDDERFKNIQQRIGLVGR